MFGVLFWAGDLRDYCGGEWAEWVEEVSVGWA